MSTFIYTSFSHKQKGSFAAHSLTPTQRQNIAFEIMSNKIPVAKMANHHRVSRKFIYQQKQKALHDIKEAFTSNSLKDSDILFHLPVTKEWIKQFSLGLIMICHSSYQGVVEIFRDLFNHDISKGSVHNIVYETLAQVVSINRKIYP